jgi:hypothetical protein
MYWRPFALPPAKTNASEGPSSASSSSVVSETKGACVGSHQIKTFYSNVSCEQAAAATAASLSESRLVERKPAPAAASKDKATVPSITSYFANISDREAEEAAAAALAAAALPSAVKRGRAESRGCAASGIARFFAAGGGGGGGEGSGGEVIVIEEWRMICSRAFFVLRGLCRCAMILLRAHCISQGSLNPHSTTIQEGTISTAIRALAR